MTPKILICANQKVENYVRAVELAGGEAVTEPSLDACQYDGLLLCGGNDVHPKYYGQEINGARDFDNERDEREIAIANAFTSTGKPILGICRGMQLLNVILGGTLIQDIEEKETHSPAKDGDRVHKAASYGFLKELYGESFVINSCHHQALDKLGDGLRVSACCDSIIEGVEHESKPYFGVQFHPERMCQSLCQEGVSDGLKIFTLFINKCKNTSV